jgi:hypothetical protein
MTRRAPPIDWPRVILELRGAGVSLTQIARSLDVGIATVHGWQNLGAEPRHSDGEALLELWGEHTVRGMAAAAIHRDSESQPA